MRADTKAQNIPVSVKKAVAERDSFEDWPCCVRCGLPAPPERPYAFSCAHYIPRSQGGLGAERNIVTLCPRCHALYDQSERREEIRGYLRDYLESKYPDWDESALFYRKDDKNG